MSRLTLVAPDLLWPRQALRDTVFDLRLPALESLIGRARRSRIAGATLGAWWRQSFNLSSPLPAAPLRRLALGLEPDDAEWLCADPVHVRFDQQGAHVEDTASAALSDDEAAALFGAVAPIFDGVGVLHLDACHAWHLRLSVPAPDLPADLSGILGRSGDALLPRGDANRAWRRLLNDAQTVLHAHPVNLARENSGRPVANSLALWGAGHRPQHCSSTFTALYSDDLTLRGLGACAGIATQATPGGYSTLSGNCVVHWDHLLAPTRRQDALAWRAGLEELERTWATPALAALQRGELQQIELIAFGDGGALTLALGRAGLWKFWRHAAALEDLAA